MTVWIEPDCTIEHEGRKFEAGGAVVTPDYVVGYVGEVLAKGYRRALTDWHGNRIGTIEFTSSWPVRSYLGSRMYQAYAEVDGVRYTGRTLGEGMSFTGKRTAKQ